jgi:hypothetical protein
MARSEQRKKKKKVACDGMKAQAVFMDTSNRGTQIVEKDKKP